MSKHKSVWLAFIASVFLAAGCDYALRLDADVSVKTRDPELLKWLQGSHVEFWAVSLGNGLSEYDAREADGFGEEVGDEDRCDGSRFDGSILRSAKWRESGGVLSARFNNCMKIVGPLWARGQ